MIKRGNGFNSGSRHSSLVGTLMWERHTHNLCLTSLSLLIPLCLGLLYPKLVLTLEKLMRFPLKFCSSEP